MRDDARSLTASRQNTGSNTATAVSPQYEHRYIVVAQGIQYRNGDIDGHMDLAKNKVPDGIVARGATIKVISPTEFECISHVQRVHFHGLVVCDKDKFIEALKKPEIHVIYDGHARYGRGPCFGPYAKHSEDWQNSTKTNLSKRGIFRMGYPFIGIEPHEIIDYGYTPNLCMSLLRPAKADCHPEAGVNHATFKRYTAKELDPSGRIEAKLANPKNTKYWGYELVKKNRKVEVYVLHDAGWENTPVDPLDLGATTLQCRVFCHFGCSTYLHNYRIMRQPEFKNWRREGNERYCYWTTAPSDKATAVIWLYHLFTYPKRNDFEPWEPSLKYAKDRTNQTLRNDNSSYGII